ncbi:MAG: hypothetical protein NOU37_09350 [Candidatus Brocadiales bacterium]|nr:hypothetical protein [Candidatus Bathyanammoxibius sp.]MCQ4575433.1 hypothetical protein [Candidatus Bathyanammoxibius amoris]
MRPLFLILLGFLITFPLGCFLNPFKSTPDAERFKYTASGKEVKGRSSGLERPEEALISRPEVIVKETTVIKERDVTVVEQGVAVFEGAPLFTVIYYARGPEQRAKGPANKSNSSIYKRAKEAHMTHMLQTGPYAAYYKQIRDRVKLHWNFLYNDVDGINYKTFNDLPIIIDARINRSGIVSNARIVENAGNPVLAALIKGAIETVLIDRFPRGIDDEFINLDFQWYFEG